MQQSIRITLDHGFGDGLHVLAIATDGADLVLQVCEFLIEVGGYCAEIDAGSS
jgi:hypothetical protein